MLKDKVRTDAYRDFIYENRDLFHGKTVLDVGCGTGILSMFCAKAGAARVIAVDNSDIIDKARANVFANKLDGTITCLRGKIEELTLPVEKVDIIVSEWMGYCLLFEAMLDSVLWARDRYLKPEGLMVPSHTRLHITPFADEDFIIQNIDFWRDVYGFNMTAMQEKITEDVIVRQMSPNSVVGTSCAFGVIDLHDIKVEDLEFVRSFEVEINGRPDGQWGVLDGWLIYFDTFFLTSRGKDLPDGAQVENWPSKDGVAFTTGPSGKETHWKSGVMVIDTSKTKPKLAFERGQTISGHIAYRKGKENSRGLEIDVQWLWTDGETSTAKQTWLLK
jgi:protein arginine N-methyltransferase 3